MVLSWWWWWLGASICTSALLFMIWYRTSLQWAGLVLKDSQRCRLKSVGTQTTSFAATVLPPCTEPDDEEEEEEKEESVVESPVFDDIPMFTPLAVILSRP